MEEISVSMHAISGFRDINDNTASLKPASRQERSAETSGSQKTASSGTTNTNSSSTVSSDKISGSFREKGFSGVVNSQNLSSSTLGTLIGSQSISSHISGAPVPAAED